MAHFVRMVWGWLRKVETRNNQFDYTQTAIWTSQPALKAFSVQCISFHRI